MADVMIKSSYVCLLSVHTMVRKSGEYGCLERFQKVWNPSIFFRGQLNKAPQFHSLRDTRNEALQISLRKSFLEEIDYRPHNTQSGNQRREALILNVQTWLRIICRSEWLRNQPHPLDNCWTVWERQTKEKKQREKVFHDYDTIGMCKKNSYSLTFNLTELKACVASIFLPDITARHLRCSGVHALISQACYFKIGGHNAMPYWYLLDWWVWCPGNLPWWQILNIFVL